MNLSQFKKVSEDNKTVELKHPSGHQIKILKTKLAPEQRMALEKMPVYKDEGGDTSTDDSSGSDSGDMQAPQPQDTQAAPVESHGATGSWDGPDTPSPAQVSSPEVVGGTESTQAAAPPPQGAIVGGSPIDLAKSYYQGLQGIKEQADVQALQSQQRAAAETQSIKDSQALQLQAKNDLAEHQKEYQSALNDYMNGHIKPNDYLENMSVPDKIATAISLFIGGFTGGFNKTGVNPAMDWLQKQQDRNIEAQKETLGQKKTLLGALQEKYHDNILAENQARVIQNGILSQQIGLAADANGTAQAKAAKDQAQYHLALESAASLQQSSIRSAALKAAQSGSFNSPEQLIPALVPKEHQAAALKEAATSKAASESYPFLMQKFDEAAKSAPGGNTLVRSLGGLRTPPAVQAMNALELPLIHDQEGRVNEFEQKTLQGLHPNPGNTDAKNAENRVAYSHFLLGKQQTPTLNAYLPGWANRPNQIQAAQETKTMGGIQYTKVPGGWKRAQ